MQYELEYAKSGRAACKVCKEKIDKGLLRIGTKAQVDKDKLADSENASKASSHILESVRWHHFQCFAKMKGKKWFSEHLPESSACSGFDGLPKEDQDSVEALFQYCKGMRTELPEPPPLRSGEAPSEPLTPTEEAKRSARGAKRPGGSAVLEDEVLTPAEKAPKLSKTPPGFTAEQLSEFEDHKAALSKRSIAQLGVVLAKNGLAKTGKKDELVERVAECRVLGVLPLCPVCEKGRLKWNRSSGVHSCPGFFDDTSNKMVRCKGPPKGGEVVRLAWQEDGLLDDHESTSSVPKGGTPKSAASISHQPLAAIFGKQAVSAPLAAPQDKLPTPNTAKDAVVPNGEAPDQTFKSEQGADYVVQTTFLPQAGPTAAGTEDGLKVTDLVLEDFMVSDVSASVDTTSSFTIQEVLPAQGCDDIGPQTGCNVTQQQLAATATPQVVHAGLIRARPIRRSKFFM